MYNDIPGPGKYDINYEYNKPRSDINCIPIHKYSKRKFKIDINEPRITMSPGIYNSESRLHYNSYINNNKANLLFDKTERKSPFGHIDE